jgi:hypothetical protein
MFCPAHIGEKSPEPFSSTFARSCAKLHCRANTIRIGNVASRHDRNFYRIII